MKAGTTGIRWQEAMVLLIGLISLTILIFVFDKPPLYDEDDYLLNVALLQKFGFSRLYLLNHKGSAGPLYPVLHYILEPFTHLRTPWIRFVNVVLLTGSIVFTGLTLKLLDLSSSFALMALAVPMTYVISGLALTEMPAIFFLSAAFYLIIKACYVSLSFINSAVHAAVGGLLLGVAILGRQPFLLVLCALPILFFKNGLKLKSIVQFFITILAAVTLPAFVFSVWGGLVSPDEVPLYSSIAEKSGSLQPVFFFLCMAYYAVVFLVVTPAFYILPGRKEIIALALLALISVLANFKFDLFPYLPMRYLAARILPPIAVVWAATIFGAGLFIGSLYFMISLTRQLIKNKFPPPLLFFAASIILIALACLKITWGFSSRYPAQALPFLVPMFAYFYRENKFNSYRLSLGVLLGLISFATFMAYN